ncbi:MAG: zinc ribbon domain-containing protein [Prevotella sp.]|nr:zinc ribbon domain-containing protein [Prevotella sp.]
MRKIVSWLLLLLCLTGCYNKGPVTPDAWNLTERQLDSISFYTTHHYTQGYNFVVSGDSLKILEQQAEMMPVPDILTAEMMAGDETMPMLSMVDSVILHHRDHLVVADIRSVPTDSIDSVWVKVARDQLTQGWLRERDLLVAVSPDDPISQFIDFFSDSHLLIFLAIGVIVGGAYGVRRLLRKGAKIVHFNDIPSFYPTLLCLLVASSAVLYSSIQIYAPEMWRHFYYHPSLNPYALPWHLGLFITSVWAILIVGIATIDDVRHHLPFGGAVLYLGGLAAICAVDYVVFSVTTLYYIGYPLLVCYFVFALYRLSLQKSI